MSPRSAVTIVAGSLTSNQTYQFMVQLSNRQNATRQAFGYLLVRVEDTRPFMIVMA